MTPPAPLTRARCAKKSSAVRSVRGRILAGARSRFLAHGFRAVTMDDLASGLGMSKKTLYAHFPDKASLLKAVLLDKFHDINADLGHIASRGVSYFPGLLHDLSACLQHHLEEIQPAFFWDIERQAPDMYTLIQAHRLKMVHRYFGKVLHEGQKAGLVERDIPAKIIIEILMAAIGAILNPQKSRELGLTPHTGFLAIARVVLQGVMTERGRERMRKYEGQGNRLTEGNS